MPAHRSPQLGPNANALLRGTAKVELPVETKAARSVAGPSAPVVRRKGKAPQRMDEQEFQYAPDEFDISAADLSPVEEFFERNERSVSGKRVAEGLAADFPQQVQRPVKQTKDVAAAAKRAVRRKGPDDDDIIEDWEENSQLARPKRADATDSHQACYQELLRVRKEVSLARRSPERGLTIVPTTSSETSRASCPPSCLTMARCKRLPS